MKSNIREKTNKKIMVKGFEPRISLSCPGAFPTELRWTIWKPNKKLPYTLFDWSHKQHVNKKCIYTFYSPWNTTLWFVFKCSSIILLLKCALIRYFKGHFHSYFSRLYLLILVTFTAILKVTSIHFLDFRQKAQ